MRYLILLFVLLQSFAHAGVLDRQLMVLISFTKEVIRVHIPKKVLILDKARLTNKEIKKIQSLKKPTYVKFPLEAIKEVKPLRPKYENMLVAFLKKEQEKNK